MKPKLILRYPPTITLLASHQSFFTQNNIKRQGNIILLTTNKCCRTNKQQLCQRIREYDDQVQPLRRRLHPPLPIH